jgi:hypothetical protein
VQSGAVRRLYFDGTEGRFVDASGKHMLRVGSWRLRSDQPVHTLNRVGNNPPGSVFGASRWTLDSGGDCLSEYFEGELQLPTGPIQVRLTLLDCYINEVAPSEAEQALKAAING